MRTLFTRLSILAIASGLVPAAMAQGTLYGTVGTGGTFDTNSFAQIGGGLLDGYADRFTSPVTADVGAASLALVAASAGNGITLTIRLNTAAGPGGIVGTFNSTTLPTDPGVITFTATSGFQLNAGTAYWLTAASSGGQVNWFDNDQSIQNITASRMAGSWTVAPVAGTALAFEVETVPEPGGLALCAAGLLFPCLARRWRMAGSSKADRPALHPQMTSEKNQP
jgi:hypothetical protein